MKDDIELAIWKKTWLIFPRRTVDGRWAYDNGPPVWRRKVNGRWQYKQDRETPDQWLERQW